MSIMWPFGLHVYVFFFFFLFFFQPAIVDFVNCEQCICVLSTVPQITLFSNFFIKNGSHNTIYTFKNYFAKMFSVSIKISSIQTHPICGSHVRGIHLSLKYRSHETILYKNFPGRTKDLAWILGLSNNCQ